MVKFGDIFRYQEKEYVYLIEDGDITYAARILSQSDSQELNAIYESKKIKGETTQRLEEKTHFCFVMLKTKEIKDRAAHLGIDTEHDVGSLLYDNVICPLEKIDLNAIIREIKSGPVPGNLKKLFEIYEET